jgi:ferric-dicitrate binding protein FerR (iron transport regulator)
MAWMSDGTSRGADALGRLAAAGPYVIAAVRDPELQRGLERAAAAGRGALDTLRDERPRDALHLLATDKRLQGRLGGTVKEVDDALSRVGVAAETRRRRRIGRWVLIIAGILVLGAAVVIAGDDETRAKLRAKIGRGPDAETDDESELTVDGQPA